jgi:AdoMet-dependent heme synthase
MLDIKLKLKPGHDDGRDWMASSPLRVLFWNVTYDCNFRCRICFASAGQQAEDELNTKEAKAMLRAAVAAGVKDIVVSGGEPFVRPDLLELLSYMAELGLGVRIASNGSLLNEGLLRRLRAETLVRSFMISVDTLDPAAYRELHGVSDELLAAALRALDHIRDLGFHTTVSARVTPQTLPGLPNLLDRAAADGWATLTLLFPVYVGRVEGAWPHDTDLIGLIEPLFERFLALPERWLVETCIPWARHHPVIQRLQERTRVSHVGCGAGRTSLVLQPTGWLCPCLCMDIPEGRLGNVRQGDVGKLFAESPICRMMRAPKAHGICEDCDEVAACGGGCRAVAFAMTRQLNGSDLSCPVRRRKLAEAAAQAAS